MKAVGYRWQLLNKDQKLPFEQIAVEDKQRYDNEVNDFKEGIFKGRSPAPQIKIQSHLDSVNAALEVSNEILEFLQVKLNTDDPIASDWPQSVLESPILGSMNQ